MSVAVMYFSRPRATHSRSDAWDECQRQPNELGGWVKAHTDTHWRWRAVVMAAWQPPAPTASDTERAEQLHACGFRQYSRKFRMLRQHPVTDDPIALIREIDPQFYDHLVREADECLKRFHAIGAPVKVSEEVMLEFIRIRKEREKVETQRHIEQHQGLRDARALLTETTP